MTLASHFIMQANVFELCFKASRLACNAIKNKKPNFFTANNEHQPKGKKMAKLALVKAVLIGAIMAPMFTLTAHADESSIWDKARASGKLRCGAAVIAPYVSLNPETKVYSGFFSELCKEFAETVLNVKPEFVDTNWDNIVAGVQSNKWDLAMALNQTPTRAMAVGFSEPVVDYEISFTFNAENPKLKGVGKSFSDFDKKGITFVVISGTAMDKSLSTAVKNAMITRLSGVDETRLALMSKRADVLVDTTDSNNLFRLKNKDWVTDIKPEPALSKQGIAFGLPRNTSYADLEVLNIFIREKKAKGEIAALVDKASQEYLDETK